MSDNDSTEIENENTEELKVDEMAMLKKRADLLGVQYSNNIGIDTLRQRIADKIAEAEKGATEAPTSQTTDEGATPDSVAPAGTKTPTLFQYMKDQHMRLIRVRIANNNPAKASHPGEIHTVANKYVGTVRQFIPYDDKSEDGWHIPYIMYKHLEDKKYLMIRETKNRQGELVTIQKMVKEFNLEVLPPLTPAEIAKLAQAQKALTD